MKSPKYLIIVLLSIALNFQSTKAEWTAIGSLSMPSYVSYCNNDVLLVGYEFLGIRELKMGSSNWNDITYNLNQKSISSIVGYNHNIYLCNGFSVFKLDTINKMWKNVTNGDLLLNSQSIQKLAATNEYLYATATAPSGDVKLFRYDQNTWEELSINNDSISITNINSNSLDVIDNVIIMSEKNGTHIISSVDNANNWNIISYKPNSIDEIIAPEIIKIKNGNYYAYSTTAGFICSFDSGKTWRSDKGPNISIPHYINNIYFGMDQIFAITDIGLFYSDYDLSVWYPYITGLFDFDLKSFCSNNKYAFTTSLSNVYSTSLNNIQMTTTDVPDLLYPADSSYIEAEDIYFDWRACNGAVSYQLQVALDSQFNQVILNVNTNIEDVYYVSSLEGAEYYYWKVAANYVNGDIKWSEPSIFGLIGNDCVPKLINPIHKAVNVDTVVTFVWSKVKFASGYDLTLSQDPEFLAGSQNYRLIPDTTYTVYALQRNTTYYWKIDPRVNSEMDDISVVNEFTTSKFKNVSYNPTDYSIRVNDDNIMISNIDLVNKPIIKLYNYLGEKFDFETLITDKEIIIYTNDLRQGVYFLQLNNQIIKFAK